MAIRLLDLQVIYGVAGAREQFERLCAQLIRAEFPTANGIRVHRGDGGVDTYVGNWADTGGIHVFQVKYFPTGLGESQRRQIKDSLQQCLSNHRFTTKRWTLCLPVDLSVDETTWFSDWIQSLSLEEIAFDWWGATRLEGLLYREDNRGIKEAFFQEEHLTQIREMHGMLRNLIDDVIIRLVGPDRESVKMQLINYLQSNLEKALSMYSLLSQRRIPLDRFDITSWLVMGNSVFSAFPSLSKTVLDAVQALEQGNRLAEHITELNKHPRYPSGFWNRDGISYAEMEEAPKQFVYQAMGILSNHILSQIVPYVGAALATLGDQTNPVSHILKTS